MAEDRIVSGSQVNEVLRMVAAMTECGDEQLTMLAAAYMVACKSLKIEKSTAIEKLAELFDREPDLVRLDRLHS